MNYLRGSTTAVYTFLCCMIVSAETIPDDGFYKAIVLNESNKVHNADNSTYSGRLEMKLVVSNFIGRGVDSVTAVGLSDRFRIYLSQNCLLPVVEPGQMDRILRTRRYRGYGVCDHNDCLIELGRFLGVRYIISGSIGKITDIYTLAVRMIDVQSGRVKKFILKDARMAPMEVLHSVIPQLAEECNDLLERILSATVTVQSIPENATIMLNEEDVGQTPMTLKNLKEGKSVLRLQMKNYLDIIDTLFLEKGKELIINYNLQMTDEYAEVLHQKRLMMKEWILQGSGILGCIAAISVGGYFNRKLRDVVDTQKEIIEEYRKAGVNADFSNYKKRYATQTALFDRRRVYRNLWYITGVVLAAGVTVTFFF